MIGFIFCRILCTMLIIYNTCYCIPGWPSPTDSDVKRNVSPVFPSIWPIPCTADMSAATPLVSDSGILKKYKSNQIFSTLKFYYQFFVTIMFLLLNALGYYQLITISLMNKIFTKMIQNLLGLSKYNTIQKNNDMKLPKLLKINLSFV